MGQEDIRAKKTKKNDQVFPFSYIIPPLSIPISKGEAVA